MLQRIEDTPQTLALRASGRVMAGEIEAAIDAGLSEAATGLVVVIEPDFDRDFTGLMRGLAASAPPMSF